jgi:hypothetical protein
MEGSMALSPKRALFVDEYVKTLNASKAARRAGYGGTPGTSRVMGCRLIKIPAVWNAIQEKIALSKTSEMSLESIIRRLERIAESTLDDIGTLGPGGFIPFEQRYITEDAMAAIQSVSTTRGPGGVTVKIVMYNAQPALERLLEYKMLLSRESAAQDHFSELEDDPEPEIKGGDS